VQKAYGKVVQKLPVMESFGQTTRVLLRGGAKAVLAPLKLFFAVNRHAIERGALHAGTGGFIRDEIQQFTGSWLQTLRTSEKAWQEVEKGLVNTPTQHRLTDELHQLLGKYESWSPMMRAIVQGPAPFIPWMLNAVRFVYWTMPAGHSALTSVIVKAGRRWRTTGRSCTRTRRRAVCARRSRTAAAAGSTWRATRRGARRSRSRRGI
jgi:hypothetical protein